MYILSTISARALSIGMWHILREASASLLVLLYRAIPEPPFVRTSNKYGPHAFSLLTNRQRGAPRGTFYMTIAKGRTNCEAERDTIIQGFNDLLGVLKDAKAQAEEQAKRALYNIIHDKSLCDEERRTQMSEYYNLLSEQEETDIRIRRTILIGMFSFWEISLRDICDYYKIAIKKGNGKKTSKNQSKADKEPNYNVNDYTTAIFHSDVPPTVELINRKIKELRNYMTHGSAGAERMAIVDSLIKEHPEFGIVKTAYYHLASYDGLDHILKTLNEGTEYAEISAQTLNVQTKKS